MSINMIPASRAFVLACRAHKDSRTMPCSKIQSISLPDLKKGFWFVSYTYVLTAIRKHSHSSFQGHQFSQCSMHAPLFTAKAFNVSVRAAAADHCSLRSIVRMLDASKITDLPSGALDPVKAADVVLGASAKVKAQPSAP